MSKPFDYAAHQRNMERLREEHRVLVTGNVTFTWSCSCGRSGTPTTEGRATTARDRHLRAAYRRIEREAAAA